MKYGWRKRRTEENFLQQIITAAGVFDEFWEMETEIKHTECSITRFKSNKFGEMLHLMLEITDLEKRKQNFLKALKDGEEPNFLEKLDALKNVGKWKQIGLEVFPTTEKLVDRANLYHVWELQSKEIFPFELEPIYILPESFEIIEVNGILIQYALKVNKTQYGPIAYLYLKKIDGTELIWRQKQFIKNELFGENLTAVEVISEESKQLTYSCLICLPIGYKLDFTLS